MNHNKPIDSIFSSEKQSDMEITMDLVSKYYFIKDSVLVRFQQNAKEQLFRKTIDLFHSTMHPTAKRLLKIIIKK